MTLAHVKAWRSKAAIGRLAGRFLAVFGGCWLLLEPLALWRPDDLRWGIQGYIWLAVVSFAIAVLWAWPKNSINRKLPASDTKIAIGVGDLLDQRGNIIIGCTDVFDTEIGDVISPSSIQGQFQTRVFHQKEKLDQAIHDDIRHRVECKTDDQKPKGKKERYPIGTVAMVEANGNRYFLLAYTRMRNDMRVESDICKLSASLNECWDAIRARGQHEPTHIGVIGSGLARIGLSRALLLQFIVLSFLDAERKENLTCQLNIHVHEKDAEHIDFVDLESWLSSLTRAA